MAQQIDKSKLIGSVWQVSKYHGELLSSIENLFTEGYYQISSMQLLFVFENICRYKANNYEGPTIEVYRKLFKHKVIAFQEHEFINGKFSIRKIRNYLAHKNQIKFNFIRIENEQEVLYPFVEDITWKWFYLAVSEILISIIYNVFCCDTSGYKKIDLKNINELNLLEVKKITPEEVLKLKGFKGEEVQRVLKDIKDESEKYRIADNASDVGIISKIFENLFKTNKE